MEGNISPLAVENARPAQLAQLSRHGAAVHAQVICQALPVVWEAKVGLPARRASSIR